jgi:hypothetical protein
MSTMTRADLLDFMRGEPLAVVASVSDAGMPEAAVVGIAVTDKFVTYLRLRPTWIRFSDFTEDPARVVEFEFSA